ncbi:site-specific integrase [Aetokthonos hydrillicola Thurmond2011]|uniref:Site-specific integrase n=1 Tax=Aetokthonos hydrillicola Thurmond2011 TaxID=2712845 RepID=A0AAP5MA69_9CYAN|nr:tyrosine-type recombinase/integrase [Aetokthonos hydrillicola]MBO3463022.1 tyrosine-type recombinase/integrase [Aetokthonos hydrillicola CCALA 1050]MBW4590839.1 site-specific integrase [Aetokthonos hydrillicola CCALA 1050]MDR9900876.1 site-specific integrase [Aetokthonos hydrillicola Thurmond2011]
MSQLDTHDSKIVSLGKSFHAPTTPQYFTLDEDPDVLEELLKEKNSPNTQRAYLKDLTDFFRSMTQRDPVPDAVLEFLHLEERQALQVVAKYKAKMRRGEGCPMGKPLSEATINRRLAAIKALVAKGRAMGICSYHLTEIKCDATAKYRDTTGINAQDFKTVLACCDLSTLQGLRDYTMLRLLWENALRRDELCSLNHEHLFLKNRQISVKAKGKGNTRVLIDISDAISNTLATWLTRSQDITRVKDDFGVAPVFVALDKNSIGKRLSGEAIRRLVVKYCEKAGVTKTMSPHRIRHSSITAYLDASDGDIRGAQALSRHKDPQTLSIYDDNRHLRQKHASIALADLLD